MKLTPGQLRALASVRGRSFKPLIRYRDGKWSVWIPGRVWGPRTDARIIAAIQFCDHKNRNSLI